MGGEGEDKKNAGEQKDYQKYDKTIGILANTPGLFDDNAEEKILRVRDKANVIREKLKKYTKFEVESANYLVGSEIKQIRALWPGIFGDTEVFYVHFDLDMFFASVEMLYDESLQNVAFGVGSNLMLSTCSYEARSFGVRAGMPGYIAKELCPGLRIVPVHFHRYKAYSKKVMTILSFYDPEMQVMGIDEGVLRFDAVGFRKLIYLYNNSHAYGLLNKRDFKISNYGPCSNLNPEKSSHIKDEAPDDYQDISAIRNERPSVSETKLSKIFEITDDAGLIDEHLNFSQDNLAKIIDLIRNVVYRNTRLTVSAGLSVTKGLAKFASNCNKPNGICSLKEKYEVYDNLGLQKINGIGKYTAELIERSLNITKISELRNQMNLIFLMFKRKTAVRLLRHSYGLSIYDSSVSETAEKSKGVSSSFPATDSYHKICDMTWQLSGSLFKRLQKLNSNGTLLTVRVKFESFKTVSRQKTVTKIFSKAEELFDSAIMNVLEIRREKGMQKIRMIGIAIGNLQSINNLDVFRQDQIVEPDCEQICCICDSSFCGVPSSLFISHVNGCIKKSERINVKKGLFTYFKPKKDLPE